MSAIHGPPIGGSWLRMFTMMPATGVPDSSTSRVVDRCSGPSSEPSTSRRRNAIASGSSPSKWSGWSGGKAARQLGRIGAQARGSVVLGSDCVREPRIDVDQLRHPRGRGATPCHDAKVALHDEGVPPGLGAHLDQAAGQRQVVSGEQPAGELGEGGGRGRRGRAVGSDGRQVGDGRALPKFRHVAQDRTLGVREGLPVDGDGSHPHRVPHGLGLDEGADPGQPGIRRPVGGGLRSTHAGHGAGRLALEHGRQVRVVDARPGRSR